MNRIRILIADDHRLIREAWTQILNKDERFHVIASCGDSETAIQYTKTMFPDIVLMDINIKPFSGLEATEKIKKLCPLSYVIGVSVFTQPTYAKKMFQFGAMGYVTKNSSYEELAEAIIEVSKGNKYISNDIKEQLSENLFATNPQVAADIYSLTVREMEIVNLIKQGYSSKEIATQLKISFKTTEVHRHNILKKLGLRNSAALVNLISKMP
jgi:DNA-binding NarL/FixJ family response regulator